MRKILSIIGLVFLMSCSATSGNKTVAEQRAAVMDMHNTALSKFYKQYPYVKKEVDQAPGYAVFSNAQINIIFAAVGGGYGVVHNNKTSKNTYMNMGEGGLGFGLGVKDFRAIFIFKTQSAMDKFINQGWAFGAEADAAAKSSDKGAEYSGSSTFGDIEVYQMTDMGVALQATVKGTKYWKSDTLN